MYVGWGGDGVSGDIGLVVLWTSAWQTPVHVYSTLVQPPAPGQACVIVWPCCAMTLGATKTVSFKTLARHELLLQLDKKD